jgi:hypothetical protein
MEDVRVGDLAEFAGTRQVLKVAVGLTNSEINDSLR